MSFHGSCREMSLHNQGVLASQDVRAKMWQGDGPKTLGNVIGADSVGFLGMKDVQESRV